MKLRLLTAVLLSAVFATPASALWDYEWDGSHDKGSANVEQMIMAGCGATEDAKNDNVDKTACHGYVDGSGEKNVAAVAMVAQKIVAHGGYFCPTQIQALRGNWFSQPWITYSRPAGFNECVWLCEDGYEGENCDPWNSEPQLCTSVDMSGYSVNKTKTGQFNAQTLHTVNQSKMVIVALTQRNDFGGVGKIIYLDVDDATNGAFFREMHIISGTTSKTLCAEGYQSSGTDCVARNSSFCQAAPEYCAGYGDNRFVPDMHEEYTVGSCIEFKCSDETKGFVSNTDKSCVTCAPDGTPSTQSGVDTDTGLCVVCTGNQVFDSAQNGCREPAQILSKDDLQYGVGNTRNSADSDVGNQCWTFMSPNDYAVCMGMATSTNSSSVGVVQTNLPTLIGGTTYNYTAVSAPVVSGNAGTTMVTSPTAQSSMIQ